MAAMAASQNGRGYLLVTGGGGVFGFGDARFHGTVAAWHKAHVVAIAETGNGGGYWLACASGQVFSFGDARFHGSPGGQLSTAIVAMAATPGGRGYWLAASGGRVFGYGDADVYGSATPALHGDRITAMAATTDGKGYWLVTSRGRVFGYGDAHSDGSATGELGSDHIVAMAATPDAKGYWLVSSGGRVFHYGDAHSHGSAIGELDGDRIVAMAATPDGSGYWLLASVPPPVGLPAPGPGFLAGHVTAIGDSVMLDAAPALEADIPGIEVEAAVSRQWDAGIALARTAQVRRPPRGDCRDRPRHQRPRERAAVHRDDECSLRCLPCRVRHRASSPGLLVGELGERHLGTRCPEVPAGPARRLQQAG